MSLESKFQGLNLNLSPNKWTEALLNLSAPELSFIPSFFTCVFAEASVSKLHPASAILF